MYVYFIYLLVKLLNQSVQILPPHSASHIFFGIDNADVWINNVAFTLFLQFQNASVEQESPVKPRIKAEPSEEAALLGKHKAQSPSPSHSIISISSDSDTPQKPPPKLKKVHVTRPVV